AFAWLTVIGLIALASAGLIVTVFLHLLDVPADQVRTTQLAILFVFLALAMSFPLNVFDATLWAFQRFDALNAVDLATAVIRASLTLWLVNAESGLLSLSLITFGTMFGNGLSKGYLSFAIDPGLHITLRNVRKEFACSILGYGVWRLGMTAGSLLV